MAPRGRGSTRTSWPPDRPRPTRTTSLPAALPHRPIRSAAIGSRCPTSSAIEKGAASLNRYASLLAKVHGWLQMANSPADASRGNYYSLALIPYSGGSPLAPGQVLHEGDQLRMALRASGQVTEKRWVYVLDIDCHGQGTVLYPQRKFRKPVSQRIRHRQSVSDPGRSHSQNRRALWHGYFHSAEHRAATVRSFCAQLRGSLALARRRGIAPGTIAEQHQQRDTRKSWPGPYQLGHRADGNSQHPPAGLAVIHNLNRRPLAPWNPEQ